MMCRIGAVKQPNGAFAPESDSGLVHLRPGALARPQTDNHYGQNTVGKRASDRRPSPSCHTALTTGFRTAHKAFEGGLERREQRVAVIRIIHRDRLNSPIHMETTVAPGYTSSFHLSIITQCRRGNPRFSGGTPICDAARHHPRAAFFSAR